jgi:hypothetical protein
LRGIVFKVKVEGKKLEVVWRCVNGKHELSFRPGWAGGILAGGVSRRMSANDIGRPGGPPERVSRNIRRPCRGGIRFVDNRWFHHRLISGGLPGLLLVPKLHSEPSHRKGGDEAKKGLGSGSSFFTRRR